MKKILDLERISFAYASETPLFSHIDTSVFLGDFIAIFGENGRGKTTLIKMILGLLKPQSGSIQWYDNHEKKIENCPYTVEYISQKANTIDAIVPITVEEVMRLNIHSPKADKKQTHCSYETLESALSHVGMLEHSKKLFRELSGGQQQRVLIAKALVSNPQILILDEPTAGIDLIAQKHLYHLLHHLNKKHHITIILISHDTQFLEEHAVKIWYIGKMDCELCHNEKLHLLEIKKMFPKNEVEFLY